MTDRRNGVADLAEEYDCGGAELVIDAETWMLAHGIRNPARITAL